VELRDQNTEFRDRNTELRAFYSELRDQNTEFRVQKVKLRDQNTEFRDQKVKLHDRNLKDEAQNFNGRAFHSDCHVLSFNCQSLKSKVPLNKGDSGGSIYIAGSEALAFLGLRAKRCPISLTTASNPDPCPLALA
jgi:hypothetical protein